MQSYRDDGDERREPMNVRRDSHGATAVAGLFEAPLLMEHMAQSVAACPQVYKHETRIGVGR